MATLADVIEQLQLARQGMEAARLRNTRARLWLLQIDPTHMAALNSAACCTYMASAYRENTEALSKLGAL